MKAMKKLLPVILCVLIVTAIAVTVFAAGGKTNVYIKVDAPANAQPGDTIKVTLSNKDMKVTSFTAGIRFDTDKLECIAIEGCFEDDLEWFYLMRTNGAEVEATAVSTPAQANANGQVGFGYAGTRERTYMEYDLLIATFVVKEGATGDIIFGFYEDTAGTDAYQNKDSEGNNITIEEVVVPSGPACDHNGKTYTYDSNKEGTHKVICECGETVNASENCSGGVATCNTKAVCERCNTAYGEFDANNHLNTSYYRKDFNIDRHTKYCADCETDVAEYDCSGGTATCTEKALCDFCPHRYGDLVPHKGNYHFVFSRPNGDQTEWLSRIVFMCTTCRTDFDTEHVAGTVNVVTPGTCQTESVLEITFDFSYVSLNDIFTWENFEVEDLIEGDIWSEENKILVVRFDGDKDPNNHIYNETTGKCECGAEKPCDHSGNNFRYDSTGNNTHTQYCLDCDQTVANSEVACSGGEANCTEAAICQHCKAAYGTENGHSFQLGIKGEELSAGNCSVAATYATKCDHCDFEDSSKVITGNKVPAVHASNNVKYENITATTHDVYYACCGALKQAGVAHEYNNHICDCDHVEHFELLVQDMTSEVTFSVPYGTNILDFLNAKVEAGEISIDRHYVDDSDSKGFEDFIGWEKWDDIPNIDEDTVVTGKMTVYATVTFTGWEIGYEELGWSYCVEGFFVEGWYQIEDAWYFFVIVEESGWNYYVTGLTRVPYNTALGHKNNETSTTYKDATEAWYFFDAAGKYESAKNGIIDGKYVVNGMIPWHPGFVTVESQLYYFVGDKDNGGNKLADGAVYITRINDVEGFKSGYIMFRDGKVDTTYTGTAEIKEDLFYFQNGICLTGVGMMETADGLIFVRSGGQLAVGDYWVTAAKANGFVEGDKLYKFSEDGILTINPEKNGIVDGVYYKEGIPYYAGLIEIDGDYYYVKSNGEVATGWYYVTKTNGIDFGTTKLFFGEDGKMQEVKNGILEGEDGKLYYYVNNRIIGAGLIKIGEDYYYVKTSTGEVVTGTYYITVTNGLEGFAAGQKCVFDKTGKLVK